MFYAMPFALRVMSAVLAVSFALMTAYADVQAVQKGVSTPAAVPEAKAPAAQPDDAAKKQDSSMDKIFSQLTPREIAILKLNSITIKHAEFEDATVQSVLKALAKQSKELDQQGQGVKITFMPDPKKAKTPPTITFSLDGMTLAELLKHISKTLKLQFKVHESGVVILRQLTDEELTPPAAATGRK